MTNQTTYSNLTELNSHIAGIIKALRIFSRTSRKKSQSTLVCSFKESAQDLQESYNMEFPQHFGSLLHKAIYAIEWGLQTGRMNPNATKFLDGLSGYQYAKLVVKLALFGGTMQDIVYYLNGKKSITYPIKSEINHD